MLIYGGFLLGFFGSLHCVGMCGPIVLVLPSGSDSTPMLFLKRLIYNVGRAVTYAVLGFIFGLFGTSMQFFGYQQHISVIAGAAMLLLALAAIFGKKLSFGSGILGIFGKKFRSGMADFMRQNTFSSSILLGLLNGLLPCGFVYIALAGAAATGNPFHGALFMALFGIGTMPALLITALLPSWSTLRNKINTNKIVPVLSICLALLFILRGLNLGIPFLSPKYEQPHSEKHHSQPVKSKIDCCD